MHRCYFLLIFPLLFVACTSTNSFTHRKYLPGFFHEPKNSELTASQNNSYAERIPAKSPLTETISVQDVIAEKSDTGTNNIVTPKHSETKSPAVQPTDTIPKTKTKREQRREQMQTDKARSGISLVFGIYSIISALIFLLMGTWLSRGAKPFTNELLLLFLLILIVIPAYFATLLAALLYSIFSLIMAQKVRKKYNGQEEYVGKKTTALGIVLAIAGFILATIAAILTLPHFLDW